MFEEHKCLILTPQFVPVLRYSFHAQKYKPFLRWTESLKHNDIETFCVWMADKYNC